MLLSIGKSVFAVCCVCCGALVLVFHFRRKTENTSINLHGLYYYTVHLFNQYYIMYWDLNVPYYSAHSHSHSLVNAQKLLRTAIYCMLCVVFVLLVCFAVVLHCHLLTVYCVHVFMILFCCVVVEHICLFVLFVLLFY